MPRSSGRSKDAVALAREAGTVGPLLDRLVDRALRAGKRARAETSVSGGIVSVASAAVELLRTELTSLAGRRVLVVGAGETARLVARQLGQARLSRLLIANRTLEAAADIAASVGGDALALPDIAGTLAGVDAVVSATRAPRFLVSAADVATAMAQRPNRPLVLIDLAVPRDIDPETARVPGVVAHAIDAIQRVVDATLSQAFGRGAAG